MGSSTNKGNISPLLFTLSWICLAIIIILVGRIMLTDIVKSGQYDNPKVATTVIGGTIYDKNKRVLAMDVPKYDVYVDPSCDNLDLLSQVLSIHLNMTPDEILNKLQQDEESLILLEEDITEETSQNITEDVAENGLESFIYIKKSYTRTYPAQFHASQLINLIESTYKDKLFPQAEFNTNITYGQDFDLTIDLDVQYLLDLAVQNIYQLQSPEFVVGQLVDLTNNQVVAVSYYPFSDLNDNSNEKAQATLISSFSYEETEVENVQVIAGIDNSQLYTTNQSILSLAENIDGTTSTIAVIGSDSSRYLLFLGSYEAKYYTNSSVLDDAVATLIGGLNSQNKL